MDFDLEKFINQWWEDFPLSSQEEGWTENSYSDDQLFWEQVFALHKNHKRVSVKSHLGQNYDFYYDCIMRHIGANDVAFTFLLANGNKETWTYKQIHHCINYHIKSWSRCDPQAGQLVILALPQGIQKIIALLTALRLGLQFLCLPTDSPFLGAKQIAKIITEINPQYIVEAIEGEFAGKEIPHLYVNEKGSDEEDEQPISFAYKADDIVQVALALYRQTPQAFVPLDAHTTYLHALRDGLITLNLKQNTTWAAPLSCPIISEPCTIITTLLAGAHHVYVSKELLQDNPTLLQYEKIHLLGLSNTLQKLWSRAPCVPTKALKAFYKTPFEINRQAWESFIKINKLEKIPTFQLLTDNSLGGVTLFSKPAIRNYDYSLKPSLGTPWSLNSPTALKSYGPFTPYLSCEENSENLYNLTLSQVESNCFLSGSVEPTKDGVTFPTTTLEELICALPFVEACMLHSIPKPGTLACHNFILLIFINPMKQTLSNEDKEQWTAEIHKQIQENLGSGFLPEHIEYFSLLPKIRYGLIDRHWCVRQFTSGLFHHKMQTPAFQLLHILKKLTFPVGL